MKLTLEERQEQLTEEYRNLLTEKLEAMDDEDLAKVWNQMCDENWESERMVLENPHSWLKILRRNENVREYYNDLDKEEKAEFKEDLEYNYNEDDKFYVFTGDMIESFDSIGDGSDDVDIEELVDYLMDENYVGDDELENIVQEYYDKMEEAEYEDEDEEEDEEDIEVYTLKSDDDKMAVVNIEATNDSEYLVKLLIENEMIILTFDKEDIERAIDEKRYNLPSWVSQRERDCMVIIKSIQEDNTEYNKVIRI